MGLLKFWPKVHSPKEVSHLCVFYKFSSMNLLRIREITPHFILSVHMKFV